MITDNIDLRRQTFVDMQSITRKQYYEYRKAAYCTGKDSFIFISETFVWLCVKDGENYYMGSMFLRGKVDKEQFTGVNVVKTQDIYRIYIDTPAIIEPDPKPTPDPTPEPDEDEEDKEAA
jgi:hypothetical protein